MSVEGAGRCTLPPWAEKRNRPLETIFRGFVTSGLLKEPPPKIGREDRLPYGTPGETEETNCLLQILKGRAHEEATRTYRTFVRYDQKQDGAVDGSEFRGSKSEALDLWRFSLMYSYATKPAPAPAEPLPPAPPPIAPEPSRAAPPGGRGMTTETIVKWLPTAGWVLGAVVAILIFRRPINRFLGYLMKRAGPKSRMVGRRPLAKPAPASPKFPGDIRPLDQPLAGGVKPTLPAPEVRVGVEVAETAAQAWRWDPSPHNKALTIVPFRGPVPLQLTETQISQVEQMRQLTVMMHALPKMALSVDSAKLDDYLRLLRIYEGQKYLEQPDRNALQLTIQVFEWLKTQAP